MEEQEKFQMLIDALGISPYQFGKDLGFKRVEPIYKILRGDTKDPGASIYSKIKSAYPQINTDWLITGEGPMMISEKREEQSDLARKLNSLEISHSNLQEMYEKLTAEKVRLMGKSKGVNLSPDRDKEFRKEMHDSTQQNVRRSSRKRVSKPMSVHVQESTLSRLFA